MYFSVAPFRSIEKKMAMILMMMLHYCCYERVGKAMSFTNSSKVISIAVMNFEFCYIMKELCIGTQLNDTFMIPIYICAAIQD